MLLFARLRLFMIKSNRLYVGSGLRRILAHSSKQSLDRHYSIVSTSRPSSSHSTIELRNPCQPPQNLARRFERSIRCTTESLQSLTANLKRLPSGQSLKANRRFRPTNGGQLAGFNGQKSRATFTWLSKFRSYSWTDRNVSSNHVLSPQRNFPSGGRNVSILMRCLNLRSKISARKKYYAMKDSHA